MRWTKLVSLLHVWRKKALGLPDGPLGDDGRVDFKRASLLLLPGDMLSNSRPQ